MSASSLLAEARERSGLSQRALAERAKSAQSVVARIELGLTSPSWETLSALIAAAGLTLEGVVREGAPHESPDLSDTDRILELTPQDRLRELEQPEAEGESRSLSGQASTRGTGSSAYAQSTTVPSRSALGLASRPFSPDRLVRTLAHHHARVVVTGAIAARLHGAPTLAASVEVVPSNDADDMERLSSSLRELGARVYTDGVPEGLACDLSAATLARGSTWRLITLAGRLDLRSAPEGAGGYDDLMRNAERFWIGGLPLLVASIEDQLRLKAATGCVKDRGDIRVLRALLARRK